MDREALGRAEKVSLRKGHFLNLRVQRMSGSERAETEERVFRAEETARVKVQGQEGKGRSETLVPPLGGLFTVII